MQFNCLFTSRLCVVNYDASLSNVIVRMPSIDLNSVQTHFLDTAIPYIQETSTEVDITTTSDNELFDRVQVTGYQFVPTLNADEAEDDPFEQMEVKTMYYNLHRTLCQHTCGSIPVVAFLLQHSCGSTSVAALL